MDLGGTHRSKTLEWRNSIQYYEVIISQRQNVGNSTGYMIQLLLVLIKKKKQILQIFLSLRDIQTNVKLRL